MTPIVQPQPHQTRNEPRRRQAWVAVTLAAAGQGEQTKAVALSITDPPEQAEAVVGVAVGQSRRSS